VRWTETERISKASEKC